MEPQSTETQPPATFTATSIPTTAWNGGPTLGTATSTAPQTFTAQDMERARQEEKEKLYGRLTKAEERAAAVEQEMARWKAEADQREAERQAKLNEKAQRKQAKLAEKAERDRAAAEADMSARQLLAERTREFEERFQSMEARQAAEKAALAKEAEFNRLSAYIQQRINQEAGSIAPQLIDLISGDTQEEVDRSIELMKAKTAEIVQSVANGQAQNRAQLRGTAPTGFTANGPVDSENNSQQLTAEQIAAMPMREFARYRGQLLGAASRSGNRGLFD